MTSLPIAFLGAGKISTALLTGFLSTPSLDKKQIYLSSKTGVSAKALAHQLGVEFSSSNSEAILKAEVIVLCMKPQQVLETLAELQPLLANKLILSTAAGIENHSLFAAAHPQSRIIRIMPNTAVALRKGVTMISSHSSATEKDKILIQELFSHLGHADQIEEVFFNLVTAMSGSAPAFALLFIEGLLKAGLKRHLDPELARRLAAHTLEGAAALVLETEEEVIKLRKNITSPQGTTAAGLKILEEKQLEETLDQAIEATIQRAQELAAS